MPGVWYPSSGVNKLSMGLVPVSVYGVASRVRVAVWGGTCMILGVLFTGRIDGRERGKGGRNRGGAGYGAA